MEADLLPLMAFPVMKCMRWPRTVKEQFGSAARKMVCSACRDWVALGRLRGHSWGAGSTRQPWQVIHRREAFGWDLPVAALRTGKTASFALPTRSKLDWEKVP